MARSSLRENRLVATHQNALAAPHQLATVVNQARMTILVQDAFYRHDSLGPGAPLVEITRQGDGDGFFDWAGRRLFLPDGEPDPMCPGAYRFQHNPSSCDLDAPDSDPRSPRYEPMHLRHRPGDTWIIDAHRPADAFDPGPFGSTGWYPDRRTGRHRRDETPDPLPAEGWEAPQDAWYPGIEERRQRRAEEEPRPPGRDGDGPRPPGRDRDEPPSRGQFGGDGNGPQPPERRGRGGDEPPSPGRGEGESRPRGWRAPEPSEPSQPSRPSESSRPWGGGGSGWDRPEPEPLPESRARWRRWNGDDRNHSVADDALTGGHRFDKLREAAFGRFLDHSAELHAAHYLPMRPALRERAARLARTIWRAVTTGATPAPKREPQAQAPGRGRACEPPRPGPFRRPPVSGEAASRFFGGAARARTCRQAAV
ncbi:hypothetical protein [Glycomyces buryatensis]|uniref:Uncharacterized protein n=1 Tax=Glycomyces buryatensis TaxID=2570927 RepID=A0A4S8QCK8_9ACTN|nr:hypothetical protein [Glycomyces buryatensis]THV42267.1 hypothetical protein FAB82_07250 [Glycomyces buryatensis]